MIVLYCYLLVVRLEIVYVSKRKPTRAIVLVAIAGIALWFAVVDARSLNELIQGIVASLLLLSFLFDNRGLAKERIVSNAMDIKGVPYSGVERVVLLRTQKQTKMNFFYRGMRGPLLIFDESLDEIVPFLTAHLKEGTPIDILSEE